MKFAHDIIIRPVLTEKSYDNMANKTYAFIVDKRATKTEVSPLSKRYSAYRLTA